MSIVISAEAAQLTAAALRFAFGAIATARKLGMSNAEINIRLDRVDRGDDPITNEESAAMLEAAQAEIDRGRGMG